MKNIEKYRNLFCDPFSKEELVMKEDSFYSNQDYPIVQGIPIFLSSNEINLNKELIRKEQNQGFSWAAKHWYNLQIDKLFEGVISKERLILLNIGSGSPAESEYYKNKSIESINLDINAKYKGVDVIGDAHCLPFKDNSFDIVTSFEVFEHLKNPFIALKEISRVLKPGGYLIGSVAFLKQFHASYFHMTHLGVIELLSQNDLNIEKIYGGQNVFPRLIGHIIVLGKIYISESIFQVIGNFVFKLRKTLWSLKKGKSSSKKDYTQINGINISFAEYDKMVYAPTIIFKARKDI